MNGPQPNPERLARLQKQLQQTWKPVKPAWSVAQTATVLALLFLVIAVAIPAAVGSAGFHVLKPGQMLLYYGLIGAAALIFAPALVRRFRPGALLSMNAAAVSLVAGAVLTGVVILLFPSLDMQHFGAGVRCLILGTVSGAIAAVFFSLVLRRGLAPNPVNAAAVSGFFAGLCGVAVLAIHCPVLTTPHILTWHLTVLLVGSAAGAVTGWRLARVR